MRRIIKAASAETPASMRNRVPWLMWTPTGSYVAARSAWM
jgi:hypothetical protein